jgi:hypothetical protein
MTIIFSVRFELETKKQQKSQAFKFKIDRYRKRDISPFTRCTRNTISRRLWHKHKKQSSSREAGETGDDPNVTPNARNESGDCL